MDAITNIKGQISKHCTFSLDSDFSLARQYDFLRNYIEIGKDKMQAAKIFTDAEIKDVYSFALLALRKKYENALIAQREQQRNNFIF